MTANAKPGHNSGLDPAQERAFLREFSAIKDAETELAEQKGVLSGVYKRLESAGFTKDDVKWAKDLEKKNVGEVIATMQRRLAIARLMGHQVGRQIDLFDKDRTPLEDAAYFEGLGAGRLRKQNANPYGMETAPGQNWQRGFNDGTKQVNEALAEAMDGLVKAGEDDDFIDEKEDADESGETNAEDDEWDRAAPEEE